MLRVKANPLASYSRLRRHCLRSIDHERAGISSSPSFVIIPTFHATACALPATVIAAAAARPEPVDRGRGRPGSCDGRGPGGGGAVSCSGRRSSRRPRLQRSRHLSALWRQRQARSGRRLPGLWWNGPRRGPGRRGRLIGLDGGCKCCASCSPALGRLTPRDKVGAIGLRLQAVIRASYKAARQRRLTFRQLS